MTTEQREAMDKLTNGEKMDFVTLVRIFKKEGIENFAVVKKEYLDTVLSLIKEQQEETDKYKALYERALSDLVKPERQIDLIIDEFYKKAKISTKCYLQKSVEECMKYKNCKECLKQYFANKVNSKKQKKGVTNEQARTTNNKTKTRQ